MSKLKSLPFQILRRKTWEGLALILGVLIMSFLIGYLVFAWTEPTQFPPGGNVEAPLNTSNTPQEKPARLTFTEFFDYTGYYVVPGGPVSANLAGSIILGDDVELSRGVANRLDLAPGDSLNLVSGNLKVGGTDVITSGRIIRVADSEAATANPSYSFSADTDTGMFRSAADTIGFKTGGTSRLTLSTTALTSTLPWRGPAGSASAPAISFSGDDDTGIFRDGANSIGFSTHGSRAMIIVGNKVGIGTDDPRARLDVYNPSNGTETLVARIRNARNAAGYNGLLVNIARTSPNTDAYALNVQTGGTSRLYVRSDGNVGIGTTWPTQKLDVIGYVRGSTGLCIADDCQTSWPTGDGVTWPLLSTIDGTTAAPAYSWSADTNMGIRRGGVDNLRFVTAGVDRLTIDSVGNVGIGTTGPEAKLDVVAGNYRIAINPGIRPQILIKDDLGNFSYINRFNDRLEITSPNSIHLAVGAAGDGTAKEPVKVWIDSAGTIMTPGSGVFGGSVGIGNGALCVDNDGGCGGFEAGSVSAVNYYTGHSDIAEYLKGAKNLEPGDVVIIDSQNYEVTLTNKPYNKRVVGVISTSPGLILGLGDGEIKDGKIPVAIAGIVPTKVTTINGPIEKGDLLTTSIIEGYAMKTNDNKPGSIIGKALESLEKGEGKINVLIMLQ